MRKIFYLFLFLIIVSCNNENKNNPDNVITTKNVCNPKPKNVPLPYTTFWLDGEQRKLPKDERYKKLESYIGAFKALYSEKEIVSIETDPKGFWVEIYYK